MDWRRAAVVGLLLATCSSAGTPDTNCANPDDPAERVRFASVVVLGVATGFDDGTARFEIEEIWRGRNYPKDVEIEVEPGRHFTSGVRYLVFPEGSPQLTDRPCSATVRWDESLAELRPESARGPGPGGVVDRDLPWEWLVLIAVVGGGIAVGRQVARHRSPEPEWNPDFEFDRNELDTTVGD